MENNLIQNLLIETENRGNDNSCECGTGFIVCSDSDDYDYVFTSLHCLKKKEIKKKCNFILHSKIYKSLKYTQVIYKDSKLDIAIVKIDKLHEGSVIYTRDYQIGEKGFFIGYADVYSDASEESKVNVEFFKNNRVKVGHEEFRFGRNNPTDILGGFSGSPVFSTKNGINILIGVIVEMSDSKFVTQQLNFVPINEFINIINDNNLCKVSTEIPHFMEICVSKTFASNNAEEIYNMLCKYAKKFEKLDVSYYIEWLNNKMFLPYGDYPNFDEKVCIGWIKYLTFMYLISTDDFYDFKSDKLDDIKFLKYIKKCRGKGLKYYYSYTCTTFQDLIPILYENKEVYKDLQYGDVVIANFGSLNPSINHIPRSKLANIVKNIGNGDLDDRLYNGNMDITLPEINKGLEILHISYFEDYLCKNWDFCATTRGLEKFIRNSIQEVIKSVRGTSL